MENKKFTILPLTEVEGKTLKEVKEYLEKTYPGRLPIEEDIKEFEASIEANGQPIIKFNWYYFFCSLLRNRGGDWCVLCVSWYGSGWDRYAYGLGLTWRSDYRVVLLGDQASPEKDL